MIRKTALLDTLVQAELLPDFILRPITRRRLQRRLRALDPGGEMRRRQRLREHVQIVRAGPMTVEIPAQQVRADDLPAEFFERTLGPRLKLSASFWTPAAKTLSDAEEAMLALTAERAELRDGQRVLDLGCGWGAMTLWLAERHRSSTITAVSDSRAQREYIETQCRQRGLSNVTVFTADVRRFDPPGDPYDRILAIELFEHLRNYERMLRRIAGWLAHDGRIFVQLLTHVRLSCLYDGSGDDEFMTRYFFPGGQMPSEDLLYHFSRDLSVAEHWRLDGTHDARTARAWLANLDRNRSTLRPLLRAAHGPEQERRLWAHWRMLFLARAELTGYRRGREWVVSQYLLTRQGRPARPRTRPHSRGIKPVTGSGGGGAST